MQMLLNISQAYKYAFFKCMQLGREIQFPMLELDQLFTG